MKNKGQSEIVGFALIIIIVAVVILVFLSFSLKKNNSEFLESRDAENFLNSMLDYTTSCESGYANFISVKKLIDKCMNNELCLNGENSCDLLEDLMPSLLNSSWQVGVEWPTKGYFMNVTYEGEELMSFNKGNSTNDAKGTFQSFDQGLDIIFIVYY